MKNLKKAVVKFSRSSADAEKLALTVKGILLGITPAVLYFTGAVNIKLTQDAWSQIIELVINIITYGGGLVSAALTLFGLARKIYYSKKV